MAIRSLIRQLECVVSKQVVFQQFANRTYGQVIKKRAKIIFVVPEKKLILWFTE